MMQYGCFHKFIQMSLAVISQDRRDRVQCTGADGRTGTDAARDRSSHEY